MPRITILACQPSVWWRWLTLGRDGHSADSLRTGCGLAALDDVDPAAGNGAHQALVPEDADRLVDRAASHAVLLHERPLGRHRAPWRQLAGQDAGAQDVRELDVDGHVAFMIDAHG